MVGESSVKQFTSTVGISNIPVFNGMKSKSNSFSSFIYNFYMKIRYVYIFKLAYMYHE